MTYYQSRIRYLLSMVITSNMTWTPAITGTKHTKFYNIKNPIWFCIIGVSPPDPNLEYCRISGVFGGKAKNPPFWHPRNLVWKYELTYHLNGTARPASSDCSEDVERSENFEEVLSCGRRLLYPEIWFVARWAYCAFHFVNFFPPSGGWKGGFYGVSSGTAPPARNQDTDKHQ